MHTCLCCVCMYVCACAAPLTRAAGLSGCTRHCGSSAVAGLAGLCLGDGEGKSRAPRARGSAPCCPAASRVGDSKHGMMKFREERNLLGLGLSTGFHDRYFILNHSCLRLYKEVRVSPALPRALVQHPLLSRLCCPPIANAASTFQQLNGGWWWGCVPEGCSCAAALFWTVLWSFWLCVMGPVVPAAGGESPLGPGWRKGGLCCWIVLPHWHLICAWSSESGRSQAAKDLQDLNSGPSLSPLLLVLQFVRAPPCPAAWISGPHCPLSWPLSPPSLQALLAPYPSVACLLCLV